MEKAIESILRILMSFYGACLILFGVFGIILI